MESIASRWNRMKTFFSETRSEMKKVTFPPRQEVISTTAVVLVASFIFALFLWVADIVILKVYEAVLRVFS